MTIGGRLRKSQPPPPPIDRVEAANANHFLGAGAARRTTATPPQESGRRRRCTFSTFPLFPSWRHFHSADLLVWAAAAAKWLFFSFSGAAQVSGFVLQIEQVGPCRRRPTGADCRARGASSHKSQKRRPPEGAWRRKRQSVARQTGAMQIKLAVCSAAPAAASRLSRRTCDESAARVRGGVNLHNNSIGALRRRRRLLLPLRL